MKKYLLLFLIAAIMLPACGDYNSAEGGKQIYNPDIHTLEKIEGLEGSKTLVLLSNGTQTSVNIEMRINGATERCMELGDVTAGVYRRLETTGGVIPCFSEIRRWRNRSGIIYGKYRPNDSSNDVWFITDAEGSVHHLPSAPVRGSGFKNSHIIKAVNGKAAYLDSYRRLVILRTEDNEEEILLSNPVSRFVVLSKNDGDHIFYTGLYGGYRKKPDLEVERISEIDSRLFFFRDRDNDIGYIDYNGYFKRIEVSNDGAITARNASAVPVAYDNWINNPTPGEPMPIGAGFEGSMENCNRSENVVVCGWKGFALGGRSIDLQEIDWCDFDHCSWEGEAKSCVNDQFIYFYSPGNSYYQSRLTQISRDFNSFEHIIVNENISDLMCIENSDLLIKTSSQVYQFNPADKIKTILPSSITEFIQ